MSQKRYLGLDIGERRTGVAIADTTVRIAVPLLTIPMDEREFRHSVAELIATHEITDIVIGFPRNQSGETTRQTEFVERTAATLHELDVKLHFQDESLTSVMAQKRLEGNGQKIEKGVIDQEAAAIILQDYIEEYV